MGDPHWELPIALFSSRHLCAPLPPRNAQTRRKRLVAAPAMQLARSASQRPALARPAPRGLRALRVSRPRAVEDQKSTPGVMLSGEETDDGASLAGDYCSIDGAGKRVKAKRRWGTRGGGCREAQPWDRAWRPGGGPGATRAHLGCSATVCGRRGSGAGACGAGAAPGVRATLARRVLHLAQSVRARQHAGASAGGPAAQRRR